jgi:hypothetical protein
MDYSAMVIDFQAEVAEWADLAFVATTQHSSVLEERCIFDSAEDL